MRRRIFVSHANEDQQLTNALVDRLLILGLGIDESRIFSSSRQRTGIPGGHSWFSWIRNELRAKPLTVSLLTPSFHDSPFSLMETGAAWIAGELIVLRHGTDRGVLASLQTLDVGSAEDLDSFADQAATALELKLNPGRWNEAKAAFLHDLQPPMRVTEAVQRPDHNHSPGDLEEIVRLVVKAEDRIQTTAMRLLAINAPKPSGERIDDVLADMDSHKLEVEKLIVLATASPILDSRQKEMVRRWTALLRAPGGPAWSGNVDKWSRASEGLKHATEDLLRELGTAGTST